MVNHLELERKWNNGAKKIMFLKHHILKAIIIEIDMKKMTMHLRVLGNNIVFIIREKITMMN